MYDDYRPILVRIVHSRVALEPFWAESLNARFELLCNVLDKDLQQSNQTYNMVTSFITHLATFSTLACLRARSAFLFDLDSLVAIEQVRFRDCHVTTVNVPRMETDRNCRTSSSPIAQL